jgi:hypothetical protein
VIKNSWEKMGGSIVYMMPGKGCPEQAFPECLSLCNSALTVSHGGGHFCNGVESRAFALLQDKNTKHNIA